MKRFISTIIISIIAISLAACGGNTDTPPDDSSTLNVDETISDNSSGVTPKVDVKVDEKANNETISDNSSEVTPKIDVKVDEKVNEVFSKPLKLNETITIGDLMEIELTKSEWVESILPSNTSEGYFYYDDIEGEKYFVIHGTVKNIGTENIEIRWISEAEVVLNDTYKFPATMELESIDGTDFNGSAKPLQTLNLIVYASVSDEAYEIYESVDVVMKILSDSENINNYFNEDFEHETFQIRFTK